MEPAIARLRWPLAVAAAAVLAVLVFVSTSWNLGRPTADGWSGGLFADDPSITLRTAMGDFLANEGQDVAGLIPSADAAAKSNPIDSRIYLLHAFAGLLANPQASAPVDLLEMSRHYDPRLRETRILLLETYGKAGRRADALAEADTLIGLLPSERDLIVELTVELIMRDESPERMAAALSKSDLRNRLMLRLAERRADPALLEKLAGRMRGLARNERDREWIGRFASAVARADMDSARRIWASLHDVDAAGVGKQVFDPEFAGLPGTPPFGWETGRSAAGLAELGDGALDVYYYGRREGTLASQLLALEPGRYSLEVALRPSGGVPGDLSWEVRCTRRKGRPTGAIVALMPAPFRDPVEFTVPHDGCLMQFVRLRGVPSDGGRRQSMTVESVRVERVGL